jgi:cytochrome c553
VMFNVAHVLSPSMLTALSAHFKDLNPQPLGGAPKELVAAGKKLYEEGVPSAEVPPCATCHGPDAKGADAFLRLAGQLHDYVYRKLTNWEKERGQDKAKPDNSAIMQPIAHNLTEAQIRAVAAYLSYQELTPALPTCGACSIDTDKANGPRLRQIKAAMDETIHGDANDRLIQKDNTS